MNGPNYPVYRPALQLGRSRAIGHRGREYFSGSRFWTSDSEEIWRPVITTAQYRRSRSSGKRHLFVEGVRAHIASSSETCKSGWPCAIFDPSKRNSFRVVGKPGVMAQIGPSGDYFRFFG